ncbi:MAG: LamG-like jellyroll fold domain-containing protein [Ginsengibacter sp.]
MKKNLFFLFLLFSKTISAQIDCNKWLYTPSRPSYVDIGKLNVTGNKITVEAVINRTSPYDVGTGNNNEGDIVSKHDNPDDVNYLLRPNHAAITTTNGYFVIPDIEPIELNKTYHVAMVYDGSTLKFYRNGCLMSQVTASGNLFQNDWNTRIGYYQSQTWNSNFIGYINEVRIWNIARTETEIRSYINSSLPNPTRQVGLLAYYIFDNLVNKQGNPAFNGTLGGNASINKTNPSCNSIEIRRLNQPTGCSKFLKTPSAPSSVRIGQLNITGNKVTVEAIVNRTTPYSPSQLWAGDIVSKHRDPTDVNYLLRPNTAEITTSNGYYKTPDIADIELNKTHHVAMVYDGSTLKFYRDGCLMSQTPASGNLVQNSWETSIGYFSPELDGNENFIGYINEVRIWKVARTQAQIQAYMNSSLPNPTTQPGLLAYYTFDNLINKQGNASFNGTLNGSASIQQTNPNCNPIDNSCEVKPCNITISKSNDTSLCGSSPVQLFASGGSDYSWTPAAGLSDPKIANPVATSLTSTKYFVTVSNADGCSKTDSINITVNSFPNISASNDTTVCENSTVKLWATGGSSYSWTPSAGMQNPNSQTPSVTASVSTKYYVTVKNAAGCSQKDSVNIIVKRLPPISVSNDTSICINSTVKLIAKGGTSYHWYPSIGLDNPNISSPLATPPTTTKYYVTTTAANMCLKTDSVNIVINNLPTVSKSKDTSVCIHSATQLWANGGAIYQWYPATGLDDPTISKPMASPLIATKYYVTVTSSAGCSKKDSINVVVKSLPIITTSKDTTICYNSQASLSANGGSSYTWTPAATLNDYHMDNPLAMPDATTTYQVKVTNAEGCSDIASIKVSVIPIPAIAKSKDSAICKNASVRLFVNGGTSYKWFPSSSLDNSTGTNVVASPSETTLYHIDITDISSCIYHDSIKISVRPSTVFSVSPDNSVCAKQSQQLMASGGDSYTWTPALFLDNPNVSSPVATADSSITYSVSIKESTCHESATLFTKLIVLPSPNVHITKSNDINCTLPSARLTVYGAENYTWTPATGLSDANIFNPVATPLVSTTYKATGKDVNGCTNSDTVSIRVDLNENRFFGLPNSFTPNGDDLNDCFGVRYWGHVDQLDFSIYNRFGQRIFFTDNSANCWNGTFKGEPQDADVYVYIIKAKTVCGNINKKGTVTLLR